IAQRVITTDPFQEHQPTDAGDYGRLFTGVEQYNAVLFDILKPVGRLSMIVISGEKVFHDGAFWRCLVNRRDQFTLEVLMLDPTSEVVEDLQRESYAEKPPSFLRDEIVDNIEVIRAMQ